MLKEKISELPIAEQLNQIKRYHPQLYKSVVIDLSISRADELFWMTGNYIVAIDASNDSAQIDIKINSSQNDAITFKKYREVRKHPFDRVYLTNTAQSGISITILYAIDFDLFEFWDKSATLLNQVSKVFTDVTAIGTQYTNEIAITATSQNLWIPANNLVCHVTSINFCVGNTASLTSGSNRHIIIKDSVNNAEIRHYLQPYDIDGIINESVMFNPPYRFVGDGSNGIILTLDSAVSLYATSNANIIGWNE